MSAFGAALAFTLAQEGGFQNDPNDTGNWTGGAIGVGKLVGTNFGISAAAYPTLDIPNLTLAMATAIYQRDYWNAISGDQLPDALALVTFDAAVNSGPGRGARWLQAALGVATDGQIGPATIAAAQGVNDTASAAASAVAFRIAFLMGLTSNYKRQLVLRAVKCSMAAAIVT